MSRTDTHRPWWVLERDPLMRRDFTVYHDHWLDEYYPCTHEPRCAPRRFERTPRHLVRRAAPCDLDQRLTGDPSIRTRCGLNPSGTRRFCSCPMCGQQSARKLGRRQERVWWRRTRANLLAVAATGDGDALDVAPFHPKAW
jgi:hypothetical protein